MSEDEIVDYRAEFIASLTLIKNLLLPAGRLIGGFKNHVMLVFDVKGD